MRGRRSPEVGRGRRTVRTAFPVLLVLAPLIGSAQPVRAQLLTGRVLDSENGNPVGVAFVEILNENGDRVTAGFTDGDGRFDLTPTGRAGPLILVVGALGYESATRELPELDGSVDTDIGDLLVEPRPISLTPLDVTAQRSRITPGREWIRQRQLLGEGRFFAGAVLATLAPRSLTGYLAQESGYWTSSDARGIPSIRNPEAECTLVFVNEWPLNRSVGVSEPVVGVRPAEREPLWTDDQLLGFPSLDHIPLEWIAAIEMYDEMRDVPPGRLQLSGGRFHACAVINVWTWNSW